MAHGFSGTMDWILPDFAADFAGAGLAVLLFDYRHFGTSPGQPRQLLDTRLQLEDLRNALAYARSREDLDGRRIALWGTSLGGSHVIDLAAADPAVAAVVANVPALDMYAGLRGRYRPPHFRPGPVATAVATARLMAAATVDTVAGALRLPPHYLPVYGALGRAAFSDPALADQFRQVQHSAASWRNEFTPRFLFHAPRYRAGTVERIGCPLLVTLARDDAQLSTPFVLQKISRARHAEVRLYPVGHFDMYHGIVREEVAHDHREFLLRWLEPT
ncbi:MAG: alpha/beta fold hydrolase [Actinomycetota bacterium]|nr:alpha/beta fold hydrolase [Actinomycetota bacterium]